jgi:2,3-bisphosphoglycerate-dependent phosphoglycerate mutase
MYKLIVLLAVLSVSCKTTSYYIVRHAEKQTATTASTTTMTSDVPLSEGGKQRAQALKDLLAKEKIKYVFSTNYIRTKSTAQPLADDIHVPIEIYDPKDPQFISKLKALNGNTLIIGHSNTVDDVVNELTGRKEIQGDLQDSEYGDLFVVKKKGRRITFERKHFGQ